MRKKQHDLFASKYLHDMDTDPHGKSPLVNPSAIVTSTPEPGCEATMYRQNSASADDVMLYSCDVREVFTTMPHEFTLLEKVHCCLHDLLIDYY